MIGDLSVLRNWSMALTGAALYAALSLALIYTGIVSSKKHSKPALVIIILLAGFGIYGLAEAISEHLRNATASSTEAFVLLILIYCILALTAWITDNKKIKLFRIILAVLIAAYTVPITAFSFLLFIDALAHA